MQAEPASPAIAVAQGEEAMLDKQLEELREQIKQARLGKQQLEKEMATLSRELAGFGGIQTSRERLLRCHLSCDLSDQDSFGRQCCTFGSCGKCCLLWEGEPCRGFRSHRQQSSTAVPSA